MPRLACAHCGLPVLAPRGRQRRAPLLLLRLRAGQPDRGRAAGRQPARLDRAAPGRGRVPGDERDDDLPAPLHGGAGGRRGARLPVGAARAGQPGDRHPGLSLRARGGGGGAAPAAEPGRADPGRLLHGLCEQRGERRARRGPGLLRHGHDAAPAGDVRQADRGDGQAPHRRPRARAGDAAAAHGDAHRDRRPARGSPRRAAGRGPAACEARRAHRRRRRHPGRCEHHRRGRLHRRVPARGTARRGTVSSRAPSTARAG